MVCKTFDQKKKKKKDLLSTSTFEAEIQKTGKGISHLRPQSQSLLGRHSGKLAFIRLVGTGIFTSGRAPFLKKKLLGRQQVREQTPTAPSATLGTWVNNPVLHD